MHMPPRPDDPLRERHGAVRAGHHNSRRAIVFAADAQRQIDAQENAVGIAKFHLTVFANRPQDAHARDHAIARADEVDQLLAGKLPLLIEVLHFGELGAGTVKFFQMFRRHMHVPSGDIDHQGIRLPAPGNRRWRHGRPNGARVGAVPQGGTDQVLDFGAVNMLELG